MNAPTLRQRLPVEERGQAYSRLETDEEFMARVGWSFDKYCYARTMRTWTVGTGRRAVEHSAWETLDETVWRVDKRQRRIVRVEPEARVV